MAESAKPVQLRARRRLPTGVGLIVAVLASAALWAAIFRAFS